MTQSRFPGPLPDEALDRLFRRARSFADLGPPVTDADLHAIYDLMKWGPTTANSQPQRILFLRSDSQKERLKPALSSLNLKKTMGAPVVAILAYDLRYFENIPRMYHRPEARSWYEGRPHEEATAFRNASLQGAYFILAARALGIDCGPMSGFDNAKVDAEFLADRGWKSNFLVNLGHGDPAAEKPRGPRFWFDETCLVL